MQTKGHISNHVQNGTGTGVVTFDCCRRNAFLIEAMPQKSPVLVLTHACHPLDVWVHNPKSHTFCYRTCLSTLPTQSALKESGTRWTWFPNVQKSHPTQKTNNVKKVTKSNAKLLKLPNNKRFVSLSLIFEDTS